MAPDDKSPVPRRRDPGLPGQNSERRSKASLWLFGVIATLLVLWALRQTVWVSMPVMAAFFIAIAVWPIVEGLQERLPVGFRWLGYVAAMAVLVATLGLFFFGVWYAASQVASQWPKYADQFQAWWATVSGWLSSIDGAEVRRSDGEGGGKATEGTSPLQIVGSFAMTIVQSIWQVLAILVLILFLVLLMLTEARVWNAKLVDATGGSRASALSAVVADVAQRFRVYVLVRTLLGLATAGLYALWLWVWGIDFLIVWALLAFLLNFVPTLGSLVAGGLACAFAFLQKDPTTAAIVALGLLVIEQVMGNYVDPLMQGRNLSLSPLVVLFMLLVWGWVWGVAGMLLAVPMTVLMVMVFARTRAMAPLALALSGEKSLEALSRQIHGR